MNALGKLPFVFFLALLATSGTARGAARTAAGAKPSPTGALEGILSDFRGRPIGGALVAAVPENPGITEEATRSAALVRTTRDGRFRFLKLPAGKYSVTATMRSHTAAYEGGLTVRPGGAVRGVALHAPQEGIVLGGTIRTTSGDPLPGAELRAVRYSDFLGDVFYALADSSGRFSVELPRAEYMLLAVASGREEATISKQSQASQTLDLRLPPLYPAGPAPDQVVAWLRNTAIPLATVEAGHGFNDMEPLKKIIGDVRVVSLGEATHGTREFFQLKHRMLEFLVREMGFNVFGIEATMPEGFDVNDYVLNGRGDPAKALAGLYFWTWNTEEVLEMIRWMRRYNADPSHSRKVKFYGFDMQSPSRAAKELTAYLRRVDKVEARHAAEVLDPLSDPYLAQHFRMLPAPRKAGIADSLRAILGRMDARKAAQSARTGERDWTLARQHGRVVDQYLNMVADNGSPIRDRSMAENIRWILDREGPDAKMVVWAHNGHVSFSPDANGMGASLKQALGDRMMVFGFSFQEGSFQAMDMGVPPRGLTKFTVGPAPAGSLDETLSRTGYPAAAFDLRAPKDGPVAEWFTAKHGTRSIGAGFSDSLGGQFLARMIAPDHYDALLFVRRTTAARRNPLAVRPPVAPGTATANMDFEEGTPGGAPPGWTGPLGGSGMVYRAETSREGARSGARCAVLKSIPGRRYGEWSGALAQKVPANPYLGKRVRLRASVRVKGSEPGCRGYLWVRGLKEGWPGAEAFYQGTEDRPIQDPTWREIELVGDVPAGTKSIDFGLALVGSGSAWIDAVSLETIGEAPPASSP